MNLHKKLTLKSTYEDIEKLEPYLSDLQKEIGFNNDLYAKLMLTVSEAVTNSVVHGNKLDESKSVVVRAKSDGKLLEFMISDEGQGFEPDDVPNPLEKENLLKTSGRGVFLMNEYAEDVSYSKDGTMLTLTFHITEQ